MITVRRDREPRYESESGFGVGLDLAGIRERSADGTAVSPAGLARRVCQS